MNRPTFRAIWIDRYRQNEDGYREVVTWDPFENWELDTAPQVGAEQELLGALEILYGHGDPDLARRFLDRCLAIADRTLAENKLMSEQCRFRYPQNYGELLRARAYAHALSGNPLDESSLLEAAGALGQACHETPRWTDMEGETYLESVRLALLGNHRFGKHEVAELRPSLKRAARWHKQESDLLQELVQSTVAGAPPLNDAFRSRFETYFDMVRDPAYNPPVFCRPYIVRLDLGLLREKFLISPDRHIDWKRAIKAIAA